MPVPIAYVFTSHVAQAVDLPGLPETLPSGHTLQESAATNAEYLPIEHRLHPEEPSPAEYDPAAHSLHDAEAVVSWYLPAAQAVQDAAPDPEYSPCPQAVQDSRPAALDLPATHEAHRSDDTAAFEASLVAYLPAVHW